MQRLIVDMKLFLIDGQVLKIDHQELVFDMQQRKIDVQNLIVDMQRFRVDDQKLIIDAAGLRRAGPAHKTERDDLTTTGSQSCQTRSDRSARR